jgi:hypothetical protein
MEYCKDDMNVPDTPIDEQRRMATLRSLGVLDTPQEERFDRLTRMGESTRLLAPCPVQSEFLCPASNDRLAGFPRSGQIQVHQ